jgi:hypothetical protein
MWIVILEGSCYGPFDAYQVAEEWAEHSECCGMKFEIMEVLLPEDKASNAKDIGPSVERELRR